MPAAAGSVAAVFPTFLAGAILNLVPVEAFLGGLAVVSLAAVIFGFSLIARTAEAKSPSASYGEGLV